MASISSQEFYLKAYSIFKNELIAWRNRYSKYEYPEKVMINSFYGQHSVDFIWNSIYEIFKNVEHTGKKVYFDFNKARDSINNNYRTAQLNDVRPVLLSLLEKKLNAGGLNFNKFSNLVLAARNKENKAIEDIEYTYIYYSLANEYLFTWAAYGLLGMTRYNAFIETTDFEINTEIMTNYENSLSLLGQYGTAQFLNKNFSPLSPLF